MAVFISRRHACDQAKLVHHSRGRNLTGVLAAYEARSNEHRPHRSLGQAAPLRALPDPAEDDIEFIRRDGLGGLIHDYVQVA
ncbi:hypothetical protein [Nonomuraea sp. NPDC050786]|uniref:hypothetical protein n=1 Tax=Nonomuraea sp. NPDC050786 TaxID=3154840 RepID=UPI00340B0416